MQPTPSAQATRSASALRVVIYVRISKDRENETSTTTQLELCRAYAKSKGWIVIAEFVEEGKSAYKKDTPRPKHDKAIRMVTSRQADIVLVWKLDRFSRSIVDFHEQWKRINDADGQIASVTESFDTTTTIGQMMLGLIIGFAQMESDAKRERAIPFHEHRIAKGLPPGGPRPYGYRRLDGSMVIVEAEASQIRGMATAILDGESLSALAARLTNGSKDVPLTLRGIKRILTSPTTAGLRKQGEGYVEGIWEPILDRATWEMVCSILNDPSRRTNFTDGSYAYLLSGIITCSECKLVMRTKTHPRGRRYLCRKCSSSIPVQTADDAVGIWLADNIDAEAWKQLREQGKAYDADVVAALEAERLVCLEMKEAGEIDILEYRRLISNLNARMEAATNSDPLDLPDIADLQSGWDGLPLSDQRTIVSTLLELVQVTPYNPAESSLERIQIERAV